MTASFDLATALRFEPVIFDAGQSAIDEQDKEQLDKPAKLLVERPNLHLVLCGHSTRKDLSTMFPRAAAEIRRQVEKKKRQAETTDDLVVDITSNVDIQLKNEYREELVGLASNRGKVVKQYLVEKYKIEPEQLILCNPEFKYEDEGNMRTEISI